MPVATSASVHAFAWHTQPRFSHTATRLRPKQLAPSQRATNLPHAEIVTARPEEFCPMPELDEYDALALEMLMTARGLVEPFD